MNLRPATLDDAERLYLWVTDPLTRRNSRRTGAIDYPGHLMWLRAMLNSAGEVRLMIAEDAGVPVGVVRLERNTRDDVEVSLTVAPEYRGKGYARRLLAAAHAEVDSKVAVLTACIWVENRASLLAFIHEGYVPSEVVDQHNVKSDPERTWLESRQFLWLRRAKPPGLAELA